MDMIEIGKAFAIYWAASLIGFIVLLNVLLALCGPAFKALMRAKLKATSAGRLFFNASVFAAVWPLHLLGWVIKKLLGA